MSGHSKWSTIKHKKAIIDSKRSGVFTKMASAITVAVKKGGGVGDPDMNFTLRLAVDKAHAVNMPKENIDRAIEKGLGKGGGKEIEELTLEGHGQDGLAVIIEAMTDNRNRTVAEVKNILEKQGGRLGEPGSVLYQFDRVGEIVGKGKLTEVIELALIDLGMIDFEIASDEFRLFTRVEGMKGIVEHLESLGISDLETTIMYRPKTALDGFDDIPYLERFMDALESHEDVQEVYANVL